MNYAGDFLPSIVRLSNYVSKQYNRSFDYQDIESLNFAREPQLEEMLHAQPYVIAQDWVYYPIFSQKLLIGIARVSRPETLEDKDLSALESIIRAVFESRIESVAAIRKLEFIENNLENLNQKSQPEPTRDNVISLKKFQKNEYPLPNKSINAPFNFPFLIEAKNADDLFKMAHEIHTRSQRFLFIQLQDLDPSALATVNSLRSLGETTIYVKEVSELTFTQQAQIYAYYTSSRDKMGPQFVVGSTSSIGELKKNTQVMPELLSHLMIGYLRMTHPFKSYKDKDILEFFFDSLAGRNYHD